MKTKAILIQYLSMEKLWGGVELGRLATDTVKEITKSLGLTLDTITAENTQKVFTDILSIAGDHENFLLFHANAPFIFESLAREILEKQEKFLVDYTFAEYLPWGIAPVAIRKDTLTQILPLLTEKKYSPFLLDQYLKNNLNSFDIEIVLRRKDYRFLKETFLATDKRSTSFLYNIFQNVPQTSSVEAFLESSLPFLRTTPSFLEVALVEDPHRRAFFQSPIIESQKQEIHLDSLLPVLQSLLHQNPSLVVQFSLQDGDPCTHSDFPKLLTFLQTHSSHNFILETFGDGLQSYIDTIRTLSNLRVVFYLGAVSENTYKLTHDHSNLKEKEELVENFLKDAPSKTYLQWVRMNENESELAHFLKRWSAYQKNIIISQYNHFGASLPDRKVVNFAPLDRFPCFKLLRDLYIRADGKIPLCSIAKQHILEEIPDSQTSPIHWDSLWNKMGTIYSLQEKKEYSKSCQNCDYWYIFNL